MFVKKELPRYRARAVLGRRMYGYSFFKANSLRKKGD